MAKFFQQFKVLMWKNALLKARNKRQVIQEVVYPLFFIAILIMIKTLTGGKEKPEIRKFSEYSIVNHHFISSMHNFTGRDILIAPDSLLSQKLCDDALSVFRELLKIGKDKGPNLKFVSDKQYMDEYYLSHLESVAAGVIFNYQNGNNYSYALRLPSTSIPDTNIWKSDNGQCRNGDGLDSSKCDVNMYLTSGFILLQLAIETAMIKREYPDYPTPNVFVEMLPKPVFKPDTSYIQIISSIFFVIAYSPFIMFLTVNLVAEKENKIREGMKLMGLRDSAFWLSWGSVYLVHISVVTVITVFVSSVSGFFSNSNVFLFFLILMFYGLSIISLAFVLTPFFNTAQTAGGVASLSTMIFSLLYLAISLTRQINDDRTVTYTIPPLARGFMCLISPCAVAQAIDQAVFLDFTDGMNFRTAADGDFPLYVPIGILLFDSVFYFLLAIYLDNVIPNEYGSSKPWYYVFMVTYWRPSSNGKEIELGGDDSDDFLNDDVEQPSAKLRKTTGIKLLNLTKEFKMKDQNFTAVKNLSLDIYQNQITCLLGHNGAGKTTLINMLTGLVVPTSGSAKVLNYSITNPLDMMKIRENAGVCPQYNILFDKLTVNEHLRLFAGIKGVDMENLDIYIECVLTDVGLTEHDNKFAWQLSGGQKRKLSVAIALIGDPKIVFLDEPTAGMDPVSRRHLWSVLKEKKKDRMIVLTTHFMDEADILADRKAFISKGHLRCCGSSLFLKSRFGIGYHLNLVVEQSADHTRIDEFISQHISGAKLNRVHGKELAFTLPLNELRNFKDLFSGLENKVSTELTGAEFLGIVSYGVSMTTLEEVFLQLEEDDISKDITGLIKEEFGGSDTCSSINDPTIDEKASKGTARLIKNPRKQQIQSEKTSLDYRQFLALIKIRYIRIRNDKRLLIINLIFPVIFVIIGLLVSKYSRTFTNLASVPLNMSTSAGQYTNVSTVPSSYNKPPFLIKDSSGTIESESFLEQLMAVFKTRNFVNSSDLIHTPSNIGIDLKNMSIRTNSVNNVEYTILYKSGATHSIPTVVTLMSQRLQDFSAIYFNRTQQKIEAVNVPLLKPTSVMKYDNAVFSSVILVAIAFVILPPGFAVDLVKDRQYKIRSQLRTAGIPFHIYWLSNFFVDVVKFLIPATLCIALIFAIGVESFHTVGAGVSLGVLFIVVIPSSTLLVYNLQFLFDNFETCQSTMTVLYFFTSFLPYMTVSLVDMISGEFPAKIIHYCSLVIFPPYTVFGGIYYIDRVYQISAKEGSLAPTLHNYYDLSSNIPITLLLPLVEIPVFLALLWFLDLKKAGIDISPEHDPTTNRDQIQSEDEDVFRERQRVNSLHNKSINEFPVVVVENLRKEFAKKATENGSNCCGDNVSDGTVTVVRNSSFAVDGGEVLGLLGPNGAGKSTTLNMIIADIPPTKGSIHLGGHDIAKKRSEAFQNLGYCPQHDALWDLVSLYDHLKAYAEIRGIPKKDIDRTIDSFINDLKIEDHKDKTPKQMSGGTKRKLSYIISMLGKPKVVLLDEPSTGMDPQSKRFLWDTINDSFRGTNRGAILTTHYMEEADNLCTRVAIMVNGKLECIGATQHLKNKFGSGYLLEVKLRLGDSSDEEDDTRLRRIESFIKSLFPNAITVEMFGTYAQFKVPKSDVSTLASVFSSLEEGKTVHGMEEYSFSQSTLEQVFIGFAKRQTDDCPTDEERNQSLLTVAKNGN